MVIKDVPPQPMPMISVHVGNIIPPILLALSSGPILGSCPCAMPQNTKESLNNLISEGKPDNQIQCVYCHYVGNSISTKVLLGFFIYIQELPYADTMKGPE